MLCLKMGQVPALVDMGAQFSCIRSDVIEYLYLATEPCKFCSRSFSGTLADGTRCKVTNAVRLHLKLLTFTWGHEFMVLDGGPFPVILGLNFLTRTQMVIDVSSKRSSFRFHPDCVGDFSSWVKAQTGHVFLQSLTDEVSQWSKELNGESILTEFPAVFSTVLGTADCAPYVIELTDSTPCVQRPIDVPRPSWLSLRPW